MKKEYDFRNAERGQVVRRKDRTRVTIHLDTDLLEELRRRADAAGRGYQTLVNEAVRQFFSHSEQRPLARRVEATGGELYVELADGRRLFVPLAWFPRLASATAEALSRFEILGDGEGIHWPEADEDLSMASLLGESPSAGSRP